MPTSDATKQAGFRLEHDGALAVLTLNAPPLNLMTLDIAKELETKLVEVHESDARALLLRADGEVFSAGADVAMFRGRTSAQAHAMLSDLGDQTTLDSLSIPTVAAVHGLCLTAGFELALRCDLIWAAESAKFGLVEAIVGLTPLAGGTQRLAQRAGIARATEAVLTGRIYDAQVMERWGVVNRVLRNDALQKKALAFAKSLAAGPTRAHAATKKVLHAFESGGIAAADAALPACAAPLFETDDLRGGVESLLAHGPGYATFTGS